jgi:DNA polymerase-4
VDDLARADERSLAAAYGPATGPWLKSLALGEHHGRVSAEPHVAKSRSRELTFQRDVADRDELRAEVAKLASVVADDIQREARIALGVTVKVRFAPFQTHSRRVRLDAPTRGADALERAALRALERFDDDRPVRLIGVRANLAPP